MDTDRDTNTNSNMDTDMIFTDMNTDMDNFNGQLNKNKNVESVKLRKILNNCSFLSAGAFFKFKNKFSSVKLIF